MAEVPVRVPADSSAAGEPVEWSESDGELARIFWGKLSEPARDLFSELMAHPGEKYFGDELAEKLNLPEGRKSVAGALGHPGRYSRELGRKWPWFWDYPDGKRARYWMTEELAELFGKAKADKR